MDSTNKIGAKKSPIEGALSYFLASHGLYIPPSAKSTIRLSGAKPKKISPIRAATLTCRPPDTGLLFWQSVILPPRIVPQLLINKQVARERTITFFMGFYCFFTHALMSSYLFMQRRTYNLTSYLRYWYDLHKKIKHAYAVGYNTLVMIRRLPVSRYKVTAERCYYGANIENNCNGYINLAVFAVKSTSL